MTEEEAVTIIHEGLVGPQSIPVKLRTRQGLDREALEKVKGALRFLVDHWKGRREVPKSVALAFVDVGTTITWANRDYTEQEQEEIEAAGMELTELALSLFDEEASE